MKKEPTKKEAIKFDAEKLPLDLLAFEALEGTAEVLRFGAKKYGAHNWREGMSWSRLFAALLRHLFLWARGKDYDAESGLRHLDHAACCLMFLQSYARNNVGTDDRSYSAN